MSRHEPRPILSKHLSDMPNDWKIFDNMHLPVRPYTYFTVTDTRVTVYSAV